MPITAFDPKQKSDLRPAVRQETSFEVSGGQRAPDRSSVVPGASLYVH